MSIGMAKPTPALVLVGVNMAVFCTTADTAPSMLSAWHQLAQWMTRCSGRFMQPQPDRNPSCQALSGCERQVRITSYPV